MELIAKTTNNGKTSEALDIAAELTGNTLFVSVEESSELITNHLNSRKLNGKVIASQLHTAESVNTTIIGWGTRGIDFDSIILDVNHGVSHTAWLKLAVDLEALGYFVVITQNIARTDVKSKNTLLVKKVA